MRRTAVFLGAMLAASTALAQQPDRWERFVAAYDEADKVSPPLKHQIVFVGSSTIRRWDVASYFPDLKIINRGIDGTELSDALKYIDRLVLRYEPRLVVVYAGDNDIGGGKLSEQVSVDFERFVRAVQTRLPETRILYIGIKPSPLRWLQVDRMRLANQVIRTICERDDRLAFLDFDNLMLGWDEKPRRELYVEDGLHLWPQGYQLWTAVLRPYLVQ
ncbi:MAG TPA: GDSL-type esterase/lipase family protein [Vicinamibacterales bacterium]|nr:GDSL-type esterase/lipase family protein [Vicinamibacterales bacterium]